MVMPVHASAAQHFEQDAAGKVVGHGADGEVHSPGQVFLAEGGHGPPDGVDETGHGRAEGAAQQGGRPVAGRSGDPAHDNGEVPDLEVFVLRFEDREQEGAQDLLEAGGVGGQGRLKPVEQREAAGIEGFQLAAEQHFDEVLTGLEVIVDRGEIHAGFAGDLAEGGGGEALPGEEAFGGIEEAILGIAG